MTGKVGRYEIRREVGRGGMATVYLAFDPYMRRQVAIKILPRQFMHDPKFLGRFQQEAQTIANLEHDAIVQVYDYGEQDDAPYLVMRYMTGGSLQERVQGRTLTIAELFPIFERLAPALDLAHARGIVHRDLKPSNVLYDEFGKPSLADFGIARLAEASHTMTVVGTPAYMSPEQVQAKEDIDGRSDIYALGVIFYELLTGEQPYKADTPTGQMMAHVLDPIPRILTANPALPQGAQRIIDKAMAKNRADRYPTVAALVTDLRDLVESQATSPGAKEMGTDIPVLPAEEESALHGEMQDAEVPAVPATAETLLEKDDQHESAVGQGGAECEPIKELTAPEATVLDSGKDDALAAEEEEPADFPSEKVRVPRWLLWAGSLIVLIIALIGVSTLLDDLFGYENEFFSRIGSREAGGVDGIEPEAAQRIEKAITAAGSNMLIIWADPGIAQPLRLALSDLAKNTGLEVVVQDVPLGDIIGRYTEEDTPDNGPDIIAIPNDFLGTFVDKDLVVSLELSDKIGLFAPEAASAFSTQDLLFGVPLTMSNVAMIRNIELVPEPILNWWQLHEVGLLLKGENRIEHVLVVPDYTYHLYGLNTAFGGYLLGMDDSGHYVAEDVGLDSPGFIASAEFLQRLIQDGLVPPITDPNMALELFSLGRLPLLISGPWSLADLRSSAVKFAIDPLPGADAGPAHPFLSVDGLVVTAYSDRRVLAQAFVQEIIASDDFMIPFMESQTALPAWIPALKRLQDNDLAAFRNAAQEAVPVPTISDMPLIWETWSEAMTSVINGENAAAALSRGAAQIREVVAHSP